MRITIPEVSDDIHSLIDWLPPGHAGMVKNYDLGCWSLMIGDQQIIDRVERNLGTWIADMINAVRGEQEGRERGLLDQLLKKYGVPTDILAAHIDKAMKP